MTTLMGSGCSQSKAVMALQITQCKSYCRPWRCVSILIVRQEYYWGSQDLRSEMHYICEQKQQTPTLGQIPGDLPWKKTYEGGMSTSALPYIEN